MNPRDILIYFSIICNGNWDKIYEMIQNKKEKIDEKDAKEVLSKINCKTLTILDSDYPDTLKLIQKPPIVLFYYGNIKLIKDISKCLAVVGSRNASNYGKMATEKFVQRLCKDLIIVSGMARGIDSYAERCAIESGGNVVSVLGSGIDVCYPTQSLDIYDQSKKKNLLISEYPGTTPPTEASFPARNRIVAGLSIGVLIPEAKISSGTSITASIAANLGREVFCIPNQIGKDSLCNYLISYGAKLVEEPEDILGELNLGKFEPIFK